MYNSICDSWIVKTAKLSQVIFEKNRNDIFKTGVSIVIALILQY